ncbi:hypothetical protein BGZ61DRAFT_69651 [Ilyonectria robusta]|uniref:uncharacterized protein n=1 Tax=Ilyonectria robusta TaxID=1079257 RepID=UPI001E8CF93B|nr:uncharacterized protein BGZ61DRAFT_69651 [Ilyonectria robusta]KAH8679261.1 hypothetical protein BGZ61DRAFT_69651 [Ilyonectria robusta]
MDSSRVTSDITSSEQGSRESADHQPRRRPGRPRMKSDVTMGPEDGSDRKARMRLAQRSYRSRKENALATEKARVLVYESTLNKILGSITEFQNFMSTKRYLPEDVMLQLRKTVSEITDLAQQAQQGDQSSPSVSGQNPDTPSKAKEFVGMSHNSQVPPKDQRPKRISDDVGFASADLASSRETSLVLSQQRLNRPRRKLPVAQSFLQACLDRTMGLLQPDSPSTRSFFPALLLPLRLHQFDEILDWTLRHISRNARYHLVDSGYDYTESSDFPKMLRILEGGIGVAVPRTPPPHLQRFQFGRTRTRLITNTPELQGEWLEAMDVEEYLEQRGIFVRGIQESDILTLSVSTPSVSPGANEEPDSLHHGTFMDSGGQSREDTVSSGDGLVLFPGVSTDGEPRSQLAHQVSQSDHHAARDFTIFGHSFRETQPVPSGLWTFKPSPQHWGSGTFRGGSRDSTLTHQIMPREQKSYNGHITISVDKLITELADRAVCLGPAPGIRRVEVDAAIKQSVISAPGTTI